MVSVRRAWDGRPEWKHATPSDRVHLWLGVSRFGIGCWFNRCGGEIGLGFFILTVRWDMLAYRRAQARERRA